LKTCITRVNLPIRLISIQHIYIFHIHITFTDQTMIQISMTLTNSITSSKTSWLHLNTIDIIQLLSCRRAFHFNSLI
jgi:hypothetical protein